jgi:Flp pilus assembly pilin Flp
VPRGLDASDVERSRFNPTFRRFPFALGALNLSLGLPNRMSTAGKTPTLKRGGGYMRYFLRFAAWVNDRDNEEGQTLVEYALIIALVSVVLIGALQLMTGALTNIFGFITSTLNSAIS